MLTKSDLERVQQLVYQYMQPTPAYAWPLLCEAAGCEVWVKHENHTPIGAFKVRGGLVYLDELMRQDGPSHLVTATRGNHGQSIPFAARQYQCAVDVFVPEGNSVEKNAAMRAWGARLHVHGCDFDEAARQAERFAEQNQAHRIPSFDEHLVRGVATCGAELFAGVADLDTVYVPVGMGSGACAMVWVRDLLGFKTDIVGVVAAGADAFAQSFDAGRVTPGAHAATFADGIATRLPHPDAFAILAQGLARVVTVTDTQIADAMRLLYHTTHNIAEGAGAAATAALLAELADGRDPGKVAVVLTGGNIDQDVFAAVLSGATPAV
ncbi:MAG: threonine dehydratase [Pseudomonadota bacterium]